VLFMKILLSWLSEYIQTDLSAEQIAEILSDLGFPCEGITHLGEDSVIDVEVSSNRGDCLSYVGLARELSVATGRQLNLPCVELDESIKNVTELASVEIAEPDLCSRYTARVIEAVKVGPSPEWIVRRLEASGLRSVNNIVDAANYAMLETGQPPHTFDYNKINGGKITVRKARRGEQIVSIDGSKCELSQDMLVIADSAGPVAVAGVMGGMHTEISQNTTNVLLEDAFFDPVTVRTASRRLALPSEAAFRFERTVDVEKIDQACARTAQLIVQLAGGKIAKGVIDVYPKKPAKRQVTLRYSRLNKLLGIDIPVQKVVETFSALGFSPSSRADSVVCSPPSWRSDICREVDLIEEAARVYGYNKIPTENKISIEVAPVDQRQKLTESVAGYLNGCGFYETVNVAFINESIAGLFTDNSSSKYLTTKDASGKSGNLLRQNLIASLLGVLRTNLNAGNVSCRIFELADTFLPASENGRLPVERTKLSFVCLESFRYLRGVVEGLIKHINSAADIDFEAFDIAWAEHGANIIVNSDCIGTAGVVNRKIRDKFDFENILPVAAELDFEKLASVRIDAVKVKPLPKYPPVDRDLSIIVDERIRWKDITDVVKQKAPSQLREVKFVEIYRGGTIAPGRKSNICSRINVLYKTFDYTP